MNRFLLTSVLLSALFATCGTVTATNSQPDVLVQNETAKSPRTKGAIFRSQVDLVIARIAKATDQPGTAAPYTTSIRDAAQMLCAMGHCHRFYVALDNPRIRATLGVLIGGRRDDGSFGPSKDEDPATTAWVVDALSVMDRDRYRDEIEMARKWLETRGLATSMFAHQVEAVSQKVRSDVFPEHLGGDALVYADAQTQNSEAAVDVAVAIPVLLQLVACQEANRELDRAQDPGSKIPPATFSPSQQKAFDYLMSQQKDGTILVKFGDQTFPDPAITGFALLALQTKPVAMRSQQESKVLDQGLRWLLAGQNDDGSFGQQVQNYTTSVVIGALSRWGDPSAKGAIEKAQRYILACQNSEQDGYQSSDRDYGSIGYGGSQRGDLSNVNFALQALRESGLPAEHEAFRKALVFLQRSQNLKGVNDWSGKVTDPDAGGKLMDIVPGDDGGAAYYPGNSAAGYDETPDGKSQPRSYGSMTYALLKAYTLCGVSKDDPKVQAAVKWIAEHWTLDENPGFAVPPGDKARYAGLYYYYMVLAQSLDMAGVDTVAAPLPKDQKDTAKPEPIEWRKALRDHLASLQQADGSFVNEKNSRWMESMQVLCTCYAMLALERCR